MWQELGIGPTDDVKAIRRAYAQRLRAVGGDRDPATFQRLRQAYESALAEAGMRTEKSDREDDRGSGSFKERSLGDGSQAEAIETSVGAASHSHAGASQEHDSTLGQDAAIAGDHISALEARRIRERIRQALAIGDIEAAFKHLQQALAQGLISLSDRPDVAVLDVISAAVDDHRLNGVIFRFMAEQLGWSRPLFAPGGLHLDLRERVSARYEAEIWFEALAAAPTVTQPRSLSNHHRRWLARLLLDEGKGLSFCILFTGYLKDQLELYDQFAPWLQHRVDQQRVEWLRSKLPRRSSVWVVLARAGENYILLERPTFFFHRFSQRSDKWGLNLEAVHCPFCGEPASDEPARSIEAAQGRVIELSAWRLWGVQSWRSRRSSATMARPGATPTVAM